MTNWTGTWRNQYDSVVTIDDEREGRISGTFRTAIPSSPFAGTEVPITGSASGDAIAFVCGAPGADVVVSYTGKLEDVRLETLWIVVDAGKDWWMSAIINHDTFERID